MSERLQKRSVRSWDELHASGKLCGVNRTPENTPVSTQNRWGIPPKRTQRVTSKDEHCSAGVMSRNGLFSTKNACEMTLDGV